MRDEEEIQAMTDKASSTISNGRIDHMDKTTLIVSDGRPHDIERLRGIRDALDWALSDTDDAPLN